MFSIGTKQQLLSIYNKCVQLYVSSITPTKCTLYIQYISITILLLHVLVYLTSSSGRTYVFLTQNHRLLQTYRLYYIGCTGLQYFYNS
jgi:hypothetical protein